MGCRRVGAGPLHIVYFFLLNDFCNELLQVPMVSFLKTFFSGAIESHNISAREEAMANVSSGKSVSVFFRFFPVFANAFV